MEAVIISNPMRLVKLILIIVVAIIVIDLVKRALDKKKGSDGEEAVDSAESNISKSVEAGDDATDSQVTEAATDDPGDTAEAGTKPHS